MKEGGEQKSGPRVKELCCRHFSNSAGGTANLPDVCCCVGHGARGEVIPKAPCSSIMQCVVLSGQPGFTSEFRT